MTHQPHASQRRPVASSSSIIGPTDSLPRGSLIRSLRSRILCSLRLRSVNALPCSCCPWDLSNCPSNVHAERFSGSRLTTSNRHRTACGVCLFACSHLPRASQMPGSVSTSCGKLAFHSRNASGSKSAKTSPSNPCASALFGSAVVMSIKYCFAAATRF